MNKTITVKGVGSVSVTPDYAVISMTLESLDKNYGKAMEMASENIAELTEALLNAGFEKEDIKTTDFNVHADYDSVKQKDDSYRQIFRGYLVKHHLKIGFDFSLERLGEALSAIGDCLANPRLSVEFTVKDPSAVKEAVLRAAAANARRKAEILCEGSGVKLGDLITIDYNWNEIRLRSRTDILEDYMKAPSFLKKSQISIQPDDIDASDTATFVWEIA